MYTVVSILLDVDDPLACECPVGFDWRAAIDEVRRLKPALDAIAGRTFELDDQVQDASFFAELAIRKPASRAIETVFAVSFSSFGRLFTDWSNCESECLPGANADAILQHIWNAGFAYVSGEALSLPYSGRNPYFVGRDWRDRYFSYL